MPPRLLVVIRTTARPTSVIKIGHLAAVQRQFEDSFVFDNLTDADIPRLDQRGIRLNLDLFGHLTDFEDGIDHRVAVDLQDDSGLHIRSESRQRRFQTIRAQRKIRQNVGSGFICYGGSADPVSVCVAVTSTPGNTAPV